MTTSFLNNLGRAYVLRPDDFSKQEDEMLIALIERAKRLEEELTRGLGVRVRDKV